MNTPEEANPTSIPAALADTLNDLEALLEEKSWDQVLARVDAAPPPFLPRADLAWRWHRAIGLAALRAGDGQRAGHELLEAFVRRPDDLQVAAALVRVRGERAPADLLPEEAQALLALELHHAQELTLTSRSLVRHRLALRCEAEDRPEDALTLHLLAHADAPEHVERARACLHALEDAGRDQRAFALREQLIATMELGPERADLCEAHAEALADMDRRAEATSFLVRAAREAPNPERLARIADRLRGLDATTALVDVLEEAAALPTAADERESALREMRSQSEASREAPLVLAERLERQLDRHPGDLHVFEWLTELLAANEAWRPLENAYTRMIERCTSDEDERLPAILWRNLAQLREQELGEVDEALFAYRMSFQFDKDEEVQNAILRLSRERSGGELPADELAQALAENPERLDLRELLGQALLREGQHDAALLQLRTVVQRGAASRPSRAALRRLEQSRAPMLTEGVPEELRRTHLRPDPVLAPLEPLFRLAGILLRDRFLNDEETVGLRRADRLDDTDLLLCRRATELGHAFGFDKVRLYRHEGIPGVVDPWFAHPTLLVAPELLSGVGDHELRFLLARAYTLMQPRFALVGRLRSAQLALVLQAMLLASDPGSATASSKEALQLSRDITRRLTDETRTLLDTCTAPVLEARLDLQLDAWLASVADEANRFGLLYADDLQDACIALGRVIPTGAGSALKLRREALIRWSSSAEHLALRQALGIALKSAS